MELRHILDLAYRQALQDMREELMKHPDEWNIEHYLDAKETVKQIVDITQIVDIMNGDAEVQ